jgi:hypothetical protein
LEQSIPDEMGRACKIHQGGWMNYMHIGFWWENPEGTHYYNAGLQQKGMEMDWILLAHALSN